MVERGNGMLRKTQCRIPDQAENVESPRYIHVYGFAELMNSAMQMG
jgi:hypothetical protein